MLDVGANRGQSALSVLTLTTKFKVLSLEPNTAMRWSLGLVWLFHPWRFRFSIAGASNEEGWAPLDVPYGKNDLSCQASLDPSEFSKDYVRERLAADGHSGRQDDFSMLKVRLVALDQLVVKPGVVKIDVQG